MVVPWGAIIGMGVSLYGASKSKKANRKEEQRFQEALKLLAELGKAQEDLFKRQEKAVTSGFDRGMASLAGAESGSFQAISAGETQAYGQATQGLLGRGLTQTSRSSALVRAIASDASRQRAQVQGQFGALRAGLETQKGAALGGILGQRSGVLSSLVGAQTSLLGSVQSQSFGPGFYENIGTFAKLFDESQKG